MGEGTGAAAAAGPQGLGDLPAREVGTGLGAQVAGAAGSRVGTGTGVAVPAPFGAGLATGLGGAAAAADAVGVAEGETADGEVGVAVG